MKNTKSICSAVFLLSYFICNAQIGINTTTPNSTLEVNGSFSSKVSQITSTTNLVIDHSVIICNSSSPIDVNLPSATGCEGRIYIIKNLTSNGVFLRPQSGQNIESASVYSLSQINSVVQLVSDGSHWYILDSYIP